MCACVRVYVYVYVCSCVYTCVVCVYVYVCMGGTEEGADRPVGQVFAGKTRSGWTTMMRAGGNTKMCRSGIWHCLEIR